MTWRHWFGVLIVLAAIAFIVAFSRVQAQERLFTPEDYIDPVVIEAFRGLQMPSRVAFGEGLILRWEGKTAFHAARNGIIRSAEGCGQPLGCIEWIDDVCVIHYETELPPIVMEALLPRLIADCGLTQ